jgi:D-lactate dehydrogenase
VKIVAFELEDWERDAFQVLCSDHDVELVKEPLTEDNVGDYADAEIVSTFIYSDLGKPVVSQLDDLQMIATRSTGYDHIAVDYCREHDIVVSNVPSYGDNTVAEHVFGLLLAISHNLVEAIDRTRRGDFSLEGLRGFDLQGKTLGVIGTGSIGRYVIEIAQGFRMPVVAFDVKPDDELAARLNFCYVGMNELLSTADIITLHVPANEKTRHLLSDDEFAKMKDGVVLINTARGGIVDIQALVRAIADGKVGAVGLDVLPEEPTIREEAELLRTIFREKHDVETLLANHILLRLRNVIITPHSAFYTIEALQRILSTSLENIEAFIRGQNQNVVTQ